VYLLPETKLVAVSYTYASDSLFLNAHLGDKYQKVSVRDSEPFFVAPMIFQQQLDISNRETRFSVCKPDGQVQVKCWLQGTKITDNTIQLTPHRRTFSNIHSSSFHVCWGTSNIDFKSMRSQVDRYFNSGFNGDLTGPASSKANCDETRGECSANNYTNAPNNQRLITKTSDALYFVHLLDKPILYFWLKAAGYKHIEEDPNIMIIPLKSVNILHENKEYRGFMTALDDCRKKWFITAEGHLIAQMDSTVTVIPQH
jgi:hypothetical protein